MDNWIIPQVIDLQKQMREQFMTFGLSSVGDRLAHTWQVTVMSGPSPGNIAGAAVAGHFRRKDGVTVSVKGTQSGNVATVTLPTEVYAVEGTVSAIMRITHPLVQTVTVAAAQFIVGQNISNKIVDPGKVIPNLDDLLALAGQISSQLQQVEKAIALATASSVNADSAANEALIAAESAKAVAAKWDQVELILTMLPPDGVANGYLTQTANSTTIHLDLPQARVTNATLYVDDATLELIQRMPVLPEVGIDYEMDPDTTEVFMRVHGY